MRISTTVITLIAGIYFSYLIVSEQESDTINQPLYAQVGMPSDTIVLNNSNVATISENTTTTPEVNDTLIGGSTPTTSNILETNEVNNKSGEAEPVGGIK
jgi:hypothetical protein